MTFSIDPSALASNLGIVANMIESVSVVMGVALFMSGIFRLKRYGEMRTFMSHQMTIASPLLLLLSGVALVCIPVVLGTGLLAFWATTNPLQYQGDQNSYDQLIPPIIMFVRIIGVCAFIRGIVMFGRAGHEQGQQGMMSRALLHVFGGILCMHIIGTIDLVKAVLGFSTG